MVSVNSCCCGCSLRTGGLIIAALVIIASIYGIAESLSNMSNPEKICLGLANAVKECSEHRMELGKDLCSITETASAKCDPKEIQEQATISLLHAIAMLVAGFCLIAGITMETPKFMWMYIVLNTLSVIGMIVFAFVSISGWLAALFIVAAVVEAYFILVVYSLKCEIEYKNAIRNTFISRAG